MVVVDAGGIYIDVNASRRLVEHQLGRSKHVAR
jgi:hypothetical protein